MINLIYTILCIVCLCMGFFVGRKTASDNRTTNKIAITNPAKTIKNKMEDKKYNEELQAQLEELNKIAENIDNYDGTSENQKELKNIEIGIL